MSLERLTWKQTLSRLRVDHRRLLELLTAQGGRPPKRAFCHPSFICVLVYRISNHFYRAKHHWVARIFRHFNMLLTGADISEPADLGEGLTIPSPAGVAIMGKAGRNLTVMACGGLGGELGRHEDVGGSPGVPVLGDDVTLEPHAGVLGPVRIGNRVRLAAGAIAITDVPDDTVVERHPPRFMRRRDLA